jgi:tetratricopeptide (TPR) repeat protein
MRVLNHLLCYAKLQFEGRDPEIAYRQRTNGERIHNFQVEISFIIPIYEKMIDATFDDTSLNETDRETTLRLYYEKILEILKPWSLCLDSDAKRVDGLSIDQIHEILDLLSDTERRLAAFYTNIDKYEAAGNHHERALFYARRYVVEGELKTTLLFEALKGYSTQRIRQNDLAGALIYAEEAYDCVAVAYDPVHWQVQEAAGILIDCLIHMGDLDKAQLYAQLTLDNLKDPANKVDQESEACALGYYNLGNVIFRQEGDLVRSEMLIRESLRIRAQLNGPERYHVASSMGLLGKILNVNKCGDEVKKLLLDSLAIYIEFEGPDGVNTKIANSNLGHFYMKLANTHVTADKKLANLKLSKAYCKEALRIYTKIFGPTDHRTIEATSELSIIIHMLSKC